MNILGSTNTKYSGGKPADHIKIDAFFWYFEFWIGLSTQCLLLNVNNTNRKENQLFIDMN
jgi:hypothetical protein